MGQKIRPTGFRIGVTDDWRSRWYAKKSEFGTLLIEDQKIRRFVKDKYAFAGIARVDIERAGDNKVTVVLRANKPGVLIGRKGANVEKLNSELSELTGRTIELRIVEIDTPELDAQLVAESIAEQLKKRMSFRRVMKKAIELAMQAGAKGCKIQLSGRLGGHEMSRTEVAAEGSIPLHTLRADIDYGFNEATTTHGVLGCKVWIFKELLKPGEKKRYSAASAPTAEALS